MARKRKQRRTDLKTGRVTHRFELKLTEPIENDLDRAIQTLKDESKFASTMREALLLKISLIEGRVDVLYDQHPHVVQRLASGDVIIQPPLPQAPQQSTPDTTKEMDELRKQNEQLKHMLEDLTTLVTSMRREGGYVMQSQQPTAGQGVTGKLIGGFKPAMPTFDEDDELETQEVKTTKNTTTSGCDNFLRQMSGLRNSESKVSQVHTVRTG